MIESRRPRRRDVSLYQGGAVIDDGLHVGWCERFEQTYRRELAAFIDAIRGKQAPHAAFADGYRAQAVAEAAVLSASENRPIGVDVL